MSHSSRLRFAPWALLLLGSAWSQRARAEQFVLVDLSYTHSAETTEDSHYYPQLPANTPKDWTKPVDYAHGSVHIVLDVKSKPAGDAPTKYQLCFEGTPSYGCTTQSPTYTKAGRVEWTSPFSSFWFDGMVDWSQGVMKMPLILKDDMNNKPAGDPKYMPTELHVLVALVSEGATFVPPAAAGSGGSAGAAGARAGAGGAAEAGRGGAGARAVASGGAGAAAGAGGAGKAASGEGGAGGAVRAAAADAGKAGAATATPAAGSGGSAGKAGAQAGAKAASNEVAPTLENSSGCSAVGAARGQASWPWIVAACLGWLWRRRLHHGV